MDWNGNGMELDWKIFGRKKWWELWWKWKWNGIFFVKTSGKKIDVMEWKCDGIEMENFK